MGERVEARRIRTRTMQRRTLDRGQPTRRMRGRVVSARKRIAKARGVATARRNARVPNRTATFDRVSKAGRRNQMVTGRITVNGRTYQFRSGGFRRGNLPKGNYTIRPHLQHRTNRSMNVGGVGYSFAMSDKYDPRVKGTRRLLRIHPDGGTPGTEGCIGIVGNAATQRRFRADMNAELKKNGGRFTLRIR